MDYIELEIELDPIQPYGDILVAQLNEINFETFTFDKNFLKCYVQLDSFNKDQCLDIISSVSSQVKLQYFFKTIKQENWNAKWEKSFEPVQINSQCVIRADFHNSNSDLKHEIIITPKMSFGTGHHETTFLVINELFNINLKCMKVLDMGSGTGVLAIICSKLGADTVLGIDIDEWAYKNSIENSMLNNVENIEFVLGDVDKIGNKKFDVVIANINRNIILRDLHLYFKKLIKGGKLIISGFLEEDLKLVLNTAKNIGFQLINKKNKNKWLMFHLEK